MNKKELMKEDKERLVNLLLASQTKRGYWQRECISLRADLIILKKRLSRIAEDIKFSKTSKGKSKVRYYPGGKDHD